MPYNVHARIVGVALSVTAWAAIPCAATNRPRPSFYFEDFQKTRGTDIDQAGFSGSGWRLDVQSSNRFMVSSGHPRLAVSPDLRFNPERDRNDGFTVQWRLEYPDDWSEHAVRWVHTAATETALKLLDRRGDPVVVLALRPNPSPNLQRRNLVLTVDGKVVRAKTITRTPVGSGDAKGTVHLKLVFPPAPKGTAPVVQVFYGEDGEIQPDPLITQRLQRKVRVDRVAFRHEPGRFMGRGRVRVDDVLVRDDDAPTLVPTSPGNLFEAVLFESNGTNVSTPFSAGDHHQAAFQLTGADTGQSLVRDWNRYQDALRMVESAVAPMNAVPLLVTKETFTAAQPDGSRPEQTFFMCSLSKESVKGPAVTILSTRGFQLARDAVTSITLQVDGGPAVNVPRQGRATLTFSGTGAKTVLATVRFASGFVGRNKFTVDVQ